ncbi:hypothetical protein WJ18_17830 [Burkholderia vietnamiensis]|nr:hypothetical protein WJ18_17830 [Burkholderia vietnamiensis]
MDSELAVVEVDVDRLLTALFVVLSPVDSEPTPVDIELTLVDIELTLVDIELTLVDIELTLVDIELTLVDIELTPVESELTDDEVEVDREYNCEPLMASLLVEVTAPGARPDNKTPAPPTFDIVSTFPVDPPVRK